MVRIKWFTLLSTYMLTPYCSHCSHCYFDSQNRLLRGYKELVLYVPLVKGIADGSCEDVTSFYKNVCTSLIWFIRCNLTHFHQLGKGSDMARGDDTASLKVAIIQWVQDLFGVPDQPLQAKHKAGRGLDHDQCGRLLCPIEFDWMDLRCEHFCLLFPRLLRSCSVSEQRFGMVILTTLSLHTPGHFSSMLVFRPK